jgi:pyrroline-5-carboxylate reductase
MAAHPGLEVVTEPVEAADVLIAVKPNVVIDACRQVAAAGVSRVLSIAAGVRTTTIAGALTAAGAIDVPVVRAMPNTPALVREGAAAVAAGPHATERDIEWAAQILGAVGTVVTVPEELLDAVTGLSGSGPAYVFLLAEAMVDGGVQCGLPPDTARELVTQTLLGAATLLRESDEGAEALRAAVTSPGGTTEAGIRALDQAGVRAAVIDAVAAATLRSAELSGG